MRIVSWFMREESSRDRRHRVRRPRLEAIEDRLAPATFTVTTLADLSNPNDGVLSLREAITAANVDFQSDVINFSVSGTIHLTAPLPDLSSNMDIRGPGAAVLTVRRQTGGDYSIFRVTGPDGLTVGMSGLTIADGKAQAGGGVYNRGTLSLADCTIRNNSADFGGGGIQSSLGTLFITDCTLSNNVVLNGPGGAVASSGTATIAGTTLSENFAAFGAGVWNSVDATATITGTSISANHGTQGAGICNFGTLTLIDSIVQGNLTDLTSDGGNGGGIYNTSQLTVTRSMIASNLAMFGHGGGIYSQGSPGPGSVTISKSRLLGNRAGQEGGGVWSWATKLGITGSTFASNLAIGLGGGVRNLDVATIIGSTFSGNAATYGGGLYNSGTGGISGSTFADNLTGNISSANGGGIYNSGLLSLDNSIVANSLRGSDLVNRFGFLSGSNNLIRTGVNLLGLSNTITADPKLGILQLNGGITESHALREGSPAIDAGDNGLVTADVFDIDGDGNTWEAVPFDQRGAGYPRRAGTVDVGAIEDSILEFRARADNGTDTLVLRRSGDDLQLVRNGSIVITRPLERTYSTDIQGADEEADSLLVDFAAGPFAIRGGIRFDGGTGTRADTVAARGDADMVLTPTGVGIFGDGVHVAVAITNVEAAQLTGGVGDNLLDAASFPGLTTLNGGSGDDQLIGGSGIDRLYGASGDDRLTGMAGNDLLDGGSGYDTLVEGGDVDFTLFNNRLIGLGKDTWRSLESAELSGGDGDNILNASKFSGPVILDGGLGDDVLVGGAFDDVLRGSEGRDLLIGGRGADDLDGGDGEDILIGGTTSYDGSRTALNSLRTAWASDASDYATRIGQIRGTISGGLNGTYRLTGKKVKHDAAENLLAGSLGLDWFLAKDPFDDVADRDTGAGEIVTAVT